MAFQPETNTYEAGVYQLETTDPVQGGVGGRSNLPLLHLSNRTAWLKQQVDDLLLDVAAAATANSPTFTGDPKAPTATAGDNDTSIATTGFVQYALAGVLSLSVAGTGSTTLTAAQAGAGVLVLTGALTGARTVVVPNTGRWIVRNATTGAFSLTVKTAAGTGVIIPQGTATEVFADGTNAYFSDNVFSVAGRVGAVTLAVADVSDAAPLASPTFTGTPSAPTPARFDNDTSLATTEFVRCALGNMFSTNAINGATTLLAANAGMLHQCFGSSPYTVTLPLANSVPPGAAFSFFCTNSTGVTISRAGTNAIQASSAQLTSITLGDGDTLRLVSDGSGAWFPEGGSSAQLGRAGAFGSSLTANGYQKLPSGLIMQWGEGASDASGQLSVTFPVAFKSSSAAYRIVAIHSGTGAAMVIEQYMARSLAGTILCIFNTGAVAVQGGIIRWFAIGI